MLDDVVDVVDGLFEHVDLDAVDLSVHYTQSVTRLFCQCNTSSAAELMFMQLHTDCTAMT